MKSLLFILISFLAVTAIISGWLLIAVPEGNLLQLSVSLLKGTVFKDYRIPGIILSFIVGGTNLLAVVFNMQGHPKRYNWAMGGGIVVCGWIIIQMILIHIINWQQVIYLVTGALIILISLQLKGKELI